MYLSPSRIFDYIFAFGDTGAIFYESHVVGPDDMTLHIGCDSGGYGIFVNNETMVYQQEGTWACPVQLSVPPLLGDPFIGFWRVPYSVRCLHSSTQTVPMC